MKPLYVSNMHGLGDSLYARAVIWQLMENHDVWLETPWPAVYHDMVPDGLKLVRKPTALRTQAKNALRQASEYSREPIPFTAERRRIWYTHDEIRKHGSFLGAMCVASGVELGRFDLPMREEWLTEAAYLVPTSKPVMLYRPLVQRTEWQGCAARNPDINAYHDLFESIRDRYFVVSVADLVPGREWIVSNPIQADVEFHRGELSFEIIAALAAMSDLVYCSPGFALILGQAVDTPTVCVFGGHESARFYKPYSMNQLLISPENACECFSKTHQCDKSINMSAAMQALRKFSDANLS